MGSASTFSPGTVVTQGPQQLLHLDRLRWGGTSSRNRGLPRPRRGLRGSCGSLFLAWFYGLFGGICFVHNDLFRLERGRLGRSRRGSRWPAVQLKGGLLNVIRKALPGGVQGGGVLGQGLIFFFLAQAARGVRYVNQDFIENIQIVVQLECGRHIP